MRILCALTYYRPHLSGLTLYQQRLAEALAARGHRVTVLTSRHARTLPREETLGGVRVVRVPAWGRVSKGQLMPGYARAAVRLLRAHDAALLNLPCTPVESLALTWVARRVARRPVVAMYHCDVRLPEGFASRLVEAVLLRGNLAAARAAERLVASTDDYARHSPLLRRFPDKLTIITPGADIPPPREEAAREFRRRHAPRGERLVGFAARFAAEKGVGVLLDALPSVAARVGPVRLLFTGDPGAVVGEESYRRAMRGRLARAAGQVVFTGRLDEAEMPAFYGACDVTVLPSTNSTESFGLAQLESMLAGTPVVASDLPGVRVPVRLTGMGRTVAPGDAAALAGAVCEVILNRQSYVRPRAEVERHFSFARMVRAYEELFEQLIAEATGAE